MQPKTFRALPPSASPDRTLILANRVSIADIKAAEGGNVRGNTPWSSSFICLSSCDFFCSFIALVAYKSLALAALAASWTSLLLIFQT